MELIWGIVARGIGLIYLIAFAQLYPQIVALAGSQGIAPVAEVLKAIRRDYTPFRRVLYFPTLLWLSASDRALKRILVAGCIAAIAVIVGGPFSPVAFLLCFVLMLSLSVAIDLPKPWDCLLDEAGFLAIFLPSLHWLPSVSATAPAPLLIAWAYRFLLFRLMFGFAKQKFIGSSWVDRDYMRGFYISQPMPTYIGWYIQRMPMWFHYICLVIMAATELVVPFFMFFPGRLSIIAAIATSALMLAIQATGGYGFFNLLTIVLCASLLDPRSLHLDVSNIPVLVVAIVVLVGGLLHFPFNTWVNQAFMFWPSLVQVRTFGIRQLLAFYRLLRSFRIIHAYGVFPPNSTPPARWLPVIEGTVDGKTWKEYEYRFMTCKANSPPVFLAPFQPRFEYCMIYEAYGSNFNGFFSSLTGTGNPYRFTRRNALRCVLQRLLEGSEPIRRLFKEDPFPGQTPVELRVNLMLFTPGNDGNWWVRRNVGPHYEPVRLQKDFWETWLPYPEIFHPDDIAWRKRAQKSTGVAENFDEFWETFVPFVQTLDRTNWKEISQTVAQLRQRFDAQKLRQFERVMGRLSTDLSDNSEVAASATFFHHVLLAYYVVGQGKESFIQAMGDRNYLAELSKTIAPQEGLFYLTLFWHDTMEFHAKKIRLLLKLVQSDAPPPPPPKGVPGFTLLLPFITDHFKSPEEALIPKPTRVGVGEWRF